MTSYTSSDEAARLVLLVEGGADADECDTLTRELRADLLDLGADSVDFVSAGAAPQGAKAADPVTLGALAMAVVPLVLPKLLEYIQSWAMRGENRKVRVKTQVGDRSIELEFSPAAVSEKELERFVAKLTGTLANPS